MQQQLIELDSRRRAALGRIGRPEHTLYLVSEQSDGTLIFEPAVVMTEHDAVLLGHPEILEILDRDSLDLSRLTPAADRPRPGTAE
jgi:hypothetical protein